MILCDSVLEVYRLSADTAEDDNSSSAGVEAPKGVLFIVKSISKSPETSKPVCKKK